MAMTASSRAPSGAGLKESERSPFARTTELLAPYTPAKPLIVLSLGEPQHPVPSFVGPVLSQHIAEFGRYPLAKGIEPFRKAAAAWLSTRFKLPRPVEPVLSGLWRRHQSSRLRTGLSADHGREWFPARPRRDRRGDAGAHRRVLHRLARESAGLGRFTRLFPQAEGALRSLRLHHPE